MSLLELPPSSIFLDCIALGAILVYAPFLVVAYGRVTVCLLYTSDAADDL